MVVAYEAPSIRCNETNVAIDLIIENISLSEYLRTFPSDEYENRLIGLIELGLSSVQKASVLQDRDFVSTRFDQLLDAIQNSVANIPDVIKTKILAEIGTDKGQALEPVDKKVNEISAVMKERADDIRRLLVEDIDPTKETSKIHQVFSKLDRHFDSSYENSIPKVIETMVSDIVADDGVVAKTVRTVVRESIKPLQDEMDRLGKEINSKNAVKDALDHTPRKGFDYEHEMVEKLGSFCMHNGLELHHIGVDNRPGDILIQGTANGLVNNPIAIVIETKARVNSVGRKRINDIMTTSMAERSVDYGIYLSKDINGLNKEIGEWAEGDNPEGTWIATTSDYLFVALRMLLARHSLSISSAGPNKVDVSAVNPQILRIRTSLKSIQIINRRTADLRQTADDIQQESEVLRDDIRGALVNIEDALRTGAE